MPLFRYRKDRLKSYMGVATQDVYFMPVQQLHLNFFLATFLGEQFKVNKLSE